jgi:hypothetical protein
LIDRKRQPVPAGGDISMIHYIPSGALPHLTALQKQAAIGWRVIGIFAIEEWQSSA